MIMACGISLSRWDFHSENCWLVRSIYLTEGEKYGKTTVTFKKPQVEKKTTQVTINSNSLNYFTKPTQQTAQKTENSRHKESPTSQVVRLTRYRSNFPSSNHSQSGSSVVLCPSLTIITALRCGGREGEESEREAQEPNLQRRSYPPSLGNRHPCRNVTCPQSQDRDYGGTGLVREHRLTKLTTILGIAHALRGVC